MSDKVRALPLDYVEAMGLCLEQIAKAYHPCLMNAQQIKILALEEGRRQERERIEGIIANKLDCYECYDVANKAQLVWAIKKAIAEE